MQITIDGPAGVGKTSVGRRVASRFSLVFIQSGQLYRAIAYARDKGLAESDIQYHAEEVGEPQLYIGKEQVVEELDSQEVGELASRLATKPEVRSQVNRIIKNTAQDKEVLVEGRDIGTVVLPGADLKIFLTASPRERAVRRRKQLGKELDLDELEREISNRDKRDSTRDLAPLKPAEDATIIDTTSKTEDEVVDRVTALVERTRVNENE